MRGRKPKPTKLKVQAGNPGKRPLNDAEPAYKPGAGSPPACLDAVGKAEWRRVSKLMTVAGVLTQADRSVLTLYCSAWSRWIVARKKLEVEGEVYTTEKGYQCPSPYVGIANQAEATVAKLGASLGLDPSSRSRLTATPAKAAGATAKPKTRPKTHLDRLGADGP